MTESDKRILMAGDQPDVAKTADEEHRIAAATRLQCAERQRVARGVKTHKFWAWADDQIQEDASVKLQAHARRRLASPEYAKRKEAALALQQFTREKKKKGSVKPLSKVNDPLLYACRTSAYRMLGSDRRASPSCPCAMCWLTVGPHLTHTSPTSSMRRCSF